MVPSGASTGIYEAIELRDADKTRYLGKGVLRACKNIEKIIKPAIIGMNVRNQKKIDNFLVKTLDGSRNQWGWKKGKLGANAILAVSLAVARAGAKSNNIPLYKHLSKLAGHNYKKFVLPVPSFNVINGGEHAGNKLAIQEFMILPTGAKTFREALRIGAECYHCLKKVIQDKYGIEACNVGDEGGFAPNLQETRDGLDLVMKGIKMAGHLGKV